MSCWCGHEQMEHYASRGHCMTASDEQPWACICHEYRPCLAWADYPGLAEMARLGAVEAAEALNEIDERRRKQGTVAAYNRVQLSEAPQDVCDLCGALVLYRAVHDRWHASLQDAQHECEREEPLD